MQQDRDFENLSATCEADIGEFTVQCILMCIFEYWKCVLPLVVGFYQNHELTLVNTPYFDR
jgi:hypothetical protein